VLARTATKMSNGTCSRLYSAQLPNLLARTL
jgi:hypothetical protein